MANDMRQMLHDGLEERLARHSMKNKLDVFNSYELKNPCDFIDCDSDSSWDNFQHLVKGDALLYCEIANSSPIGEDGSETAHQKSMKNYEIMAK